MKRARSRFLHHTGLSPYLQEMVSQFAQDTGIVVEFNFPVDLDTLVSDTDIREVLYAVWQQAFTNVDQHAQATKVTAQMTIKADQLAFKVCDNGRGCLPEERTAALKNGHFGLRSLEIRLRSIDGIFEFRSTLG